MVIKRNFAITVLDAEKISDINEILIENADIAMQSSSHMYFDTQPVNPKDVAQDITFFQLESDDESGLDKKLKRFN